MAKRTINLDTKEIQEILLAMEAYKNEHKVNISFDSIIKKFKNNLKTIKIASRKGKGRNLQKFICQEIADLLSITYDQSDDNCLIQSRPMGMSGLDVILRGDALIDFPFSIEAKCAESLNILQTFGQVTKNQLPMTDWMIVHQRKSIPEPLCIISWDAFKRLYKK